MKKIIIPKRNKEPKDYTEQYKNERNKVREFIPLPSDLINSPSSWPEWRLTDRMKVVKR